MCSMLARSGPIQNLRWLQWLAMPGPFRQQARGLAVLAVLPLKQPIGQLSWQQPARHFDDCCSNQGHKVLALERRCHLSRLGHLAHLKQTPWRNLPAKLRQNLHPPQHSSALLPAKFAGLLLFVLLLLACPAWSVPVLLKLRLQAAWQLQAPL